MKKPKNKGVTLDKFELDYEDIEQKERRVAKKTTKKPVLARNTKSKRRGIRGFVVSRFKTVHKSVTSAVNKHKQPKKKAKRLTKQEQEIANLLAKKQRANAIIGIGLLLVVVSIAYSTYIVRTFVDTNMSLAALAPQVVFALCISIKAFSKLYK